MKTFLVDKVRSKVNNETVGIDIQSAKECLFFLPVVWHFDLVKFQEKEFFNDFSHSLGRICGFDFNVLGFCTFATIDKNNFVFGEISTFY